MAGSRIAALTALLMLYGPAQAQMPAEVATRLHEIGQVIAPPATAKLYEPRMLATSSPATVERDLRYGHAERNLLDVFTPAAASPQPRPVLVFVHGGAFLRGDRRLPGGSPFYDNVMHWAVDQGMVGVNVTYRMLPQAAWPSGADDLAQALHWVAAHIAERGGDPHRVFVLGHSTGAGIVASYLARELPPAPGQPGLAGAMLMSGVYEVTEALLDGDTAAKAYFGDDPARFGERSALPGLVESRVPIWVGYAELDPPKFEQQAKRLNDALCAARRCPPMVRFADHSHMSEAYSIETDDSTVGDALRAFVSAQLQPSPP